MLNLHGSAVLTFSAAQPPENCPGSSLYFSVLIVCGAHLGTYFLVLSAEHAAALLKARLYVLPAISTTRSTTKAQPWRDDAPDSTTPIHLVMSHDSFCLCLLDNTSTLFFALTRLAAKQSRLLAAATSIPARISRSLLASSRRAFAQRPDRGFSLDAVKHT